MEYSGKSIEVNFGGRTLCLYNQSCMDWTHPYPYLGNPETVNANLHTSGCGIFTIAHIVKWHTGQEYAVEALADFSCANGGRVDGGTCRPILLSALEEKGELRKVLLHYDGLGEQNDHEALWNALQNGGYACANLREGHIVAIVDSRIKDDERQVLVIDSSRDSVHPSVRASVREVVDGTQIYAKYVNQRGVFTGESMHYLMYYVPLSQAFDFNLLYSL